MSDSEPHYLERELYERVRSDEEIFEFLLAGSIDGLWYWDLENPEHEWMNARFWEVLGYDPATREHRRSEWQKLINPEDLQTALANFEEHCKNPAHPYDQVLRFRRRDSSTVWIRCRGIAIRNAAGKPVRMLGAHTDISELKRTEARLLEAERWSAAVNAALRESEERYRTLYEEAPVMHVNVDPETGLIKDCNQLTVHRLGYPDKDEIIGLPIFDLYHQDCLAEVRAAFKRFAKMGKMEHVELTLKTRDGAKVPVILNVASVRDADGKILYSSSTWVETTELKEAQAALDSEREQQRVEAEMQRRAALNLAADAERARQRAEDAERRLSVVASQLALPPREFVPTEKGYHLSDFSLRDMIACGAEIRDLSRRHDSLEGISKEIARFFQRRFTREDSSSEFALVRLFRTDRLGNLTDEQQAFARSLQADVEPDAVCLQLAGTAGDREEWNDISQSREVLTVPLGAPDAADRLPLVADLLRSLGQEVGAPAKPHAELFLDDVTGRTMHLANAIDSPHLPDQKGFIAPYGIRSVIGLGDTLPGGGLFVLVAFSRRTISEEAARLFSHLSHSIKLALLPHLESERRTVEQILAFDRLLANHEEIVAVQEAKLHETMAALTESNEELDQFAYVASHDLKGPLRAIDNLAKWIEEDNETILPESARTDLTSLRGRVERMDGLLDSLLTYCRVGRTEDKVVQVDVGRLLEDLVEMHEVPAGFTIDIGDNMPQLPAPRAALMRVFGNLIGNALKHAESDQGRIRITATSSANGLVEFLVQDDGPGIDPRFQKRIFEMFQTLKPRDEQEGSGMGLAIVKKTVEHHGGTIRVESTPGEGTTFIFTWPKGLENE